MTLKLTKLLIMTVLIVLPGLVSAQVDNFGVLDTLYAELNKIDSHNWSITVLYSNDQSVVGMSVPLKISAGDNRIVGDSAIYSGGRVEDFAVKTFRADTAIQCVTMGMIANMGPSNKTLLPGKGRLLTIFVSSLEGKPIEKLSVDTTTTSPNNSLLVIADRYQGGEKPDTIKHEDRKLLEIRPAFKVIMPK